MEPVAARRLLELSADDEEPVLIPPEVLSHLSIDDIPQGSRFEVGRMKDGVIHLAWNGSFYAEDGTLFGEADHSWTRKYWYSPLGLEQYMDLVQRSAELRQRVRGDVVSIDSDDDGAYVHLRYVIVSTETKLDKAYAKIKKIDLEIAEAASQAADEVGVRIAEVAARLSGWGSNSLDSLVDAVEGASNASDKGRALEELCARTFSAVDGFSVSQRVLTETEEIDISIVNESSDPRLTREGALILVECKNWLSHCGRSEFTIFRGKMENISKRCSLGFLVSWNGFTDTITKEMLRGSREETLIIPVTGSDIRSAVRKNDFSGMLLRLWDEAVSI